MKNVMVKKVDGSAISLTYEELCHDLGFLPAIRFVKVTNRHTVTFTCGKLNEIRALRKACKDRGYVMAKSLDLWAYL